MIVCEAEQGTEQWFLDRSGVPSASNFEKIITPSGSKSTQSKGYMNRVLAEYHLDRPVVSCEPTEWMIRGNLLEEEARGLYSVLRDVPVEQVGFVYKDKFKLVGCSPDGLVGKDGLLEIKCPAEATMISYMLDGELPKKYIPQVQGQMWVMDKMWCDFMAYHPDFEPIIIRVERDDAYFRKLSDYMTAFIAEMLEGRAKVGKRG